MAPILPLAYLKKVTAWCLVGWLLAATFISCLNRPSLDLNWFLGFPVSVTLVFEAGYLEWTQSKIPLGHHPGGPKWYPGEEYRVYGQGSVIRQLLTKPRFSRIAPRNHSPLGFPTTTVAVVVAVVPYWLIVALIMSILLVIKSRWDRFE